MLFTLIYQINFDTLQLFACHTWLGQLFRATSVLNRSNQNCSQSS